MENLGKKTAREIIRLLDSKALNPAIFRPHTAEDGSVYFTVTADALDEIANEILDAYGLNPESE